LTTFGSALAAGAGDVAGAGAGDPAGDAAGDAAAAGGLLGCGADGAGVCADAGTIAASVTNPNATAVRTIMRGASTPKLQPPAVTMRR
jgi:hypothetical protein